MRGHVPGLASPHPLGPKLPALLQEDDLVQRLMLAFDELLAPVLLTLDNLAAHIDPMTCPEDWVNWLAEWVALPAMMQETLQQRRARVAVAHIEHVDGGTVHGLQTTLATALSGKVEVQDSGGTQWSPIPGGPLPGTPEPFVSLRVQAAGITAQQVRALAFDLVPAHVRIDVEVSAP